MTLLVLRIIGALSGLVTALNVALGFMKTPEFVVPDYLVGLFLVAPALVARREAARLGLFAGNAFALGVFSVALSDRMQPDGVFNPGLVVLMLVCAGALLALAFMKAERR